jgi:long-chain fatty acid transport protein
LLLSWSLFSPTRLGAVGFRVPNQDPEAIARGNAFAATADNPSAIYYNPAGITQLEGQHFHAGLYLISGDTQYRSPTGATADTKSDFQPVPQLYYVNSSKDGRFAFGLGVYAPYGLSLDWGNNPPFRTLAQDGKLLYATANPVIAWRVHPTFSIAIGPTINYSQVTFRQGIGLFPGDRFKFQGDGLDYGFNAGARWQPHRRWAFGVNYRYATTIDYDGTAETRPASPSPPFFGRTDASGSIRFPQFVAVGVSFRPTEHWNLEFDIDWTDWDNLNQVAFRGINVPPLPLNYRSSLMYEVGLTRQLGKGYSISAGYIFSENSSPDRYFNPIVPDSDLHLGSIGFGHRGKRWNWAIGYHFAHNPRREVRGSPTPFFGPSADGTYRTLNHAINLSATLKF